MTNTPQPGRPRLPGRPRIVVGYAHTPAGSAALRWAVLEAQRTGAEIEAVHVFDLRRRADAALSRDPEELRVEARRRAEQRVRDVVAGLGTRTRVRFTALVGDVEQTLAANARHADRLVLGEPGHRTDQSLPERLSRQCAAPVTVVSESGAAQELAEGSPRISS